MKYINRHVSNLKKLRDDENAQLRCVAARIAAAQGANIRLENGEAAGQDEFHCHLRVHPRYAGDGKLLFDPRYKPMTKR